jgi:hypothetical protein
MAQCVNLPLGPSCVNLSGVRAGDLNQFQITLSRKGIPMNLTGLTLTAQARAKVTDTEFIDAVITVTDAPNGVLLLRWPGSDVATWLGAKATKTGVWDLQVDDGVADPTTVAAGSFAAEWDVTR